METTGENSGTLCHERHVGDEDERDREERGWEKGTKMERRGENAAWKGGEKDGKAYENDVCVTAVDIDAPSGH